MKRALACLALLFATSAAAQEAVPGAEISYTKTTYPQELVRRPLVLAPDMLEVQVGLASNAFDMDRYAGNLSLGWAPGPRIELGALLGMPFIPTDEFAVDWAGVYAEYSVAPKASLRLDGYMAIPRVGTELGDASFLVRLAVPVKWRTGDQIGFVVQPDFTYGLNDSLQRLSLNGDVQLQVVTQLAIYLGTAFAITDWEVDNAHIAMPFHAGALLAVTRTFDLGVEYGMADLTDSVGRDAQSILGFFQFRQ